MWRWDQGRLQYFSLNHITKISTTLQRLNGADLPAEDDPLRSALEKEVGLPFAPQNYRVWRNYARVFKVLGLASKIDNKLEVTGLCKQLSVQGVGYLTYDDYILYLTKVFYYPSPMFQGYDVHSTQKFPFCAILKFLVAKSYNTGDPSCSVEEIISYLIGNSVSGLEPLEFYTTLLPSDGKGDSRQIREVLIFVSQLSFLAWFNGKLFMDLSSLNGLSNDNLLSLMTPIVKKRYADPELEIQNMFSFGADNYPLVTLDVSTSAEDRVFTEGKRIRVSHLRTERNRKVVKYYFDKCSNPALCDICRREVRDHYPWLDNLIEVHHILPLSSPLSVNKKGTSITDLVGLCPNCHRATHAFYKIFLKQQQLEDFVSEEQAKDIYSMVRSTFVKL